MVHSKDLLDLDRGVIFVGFDFIPSLFAAAVRMFELWQTPDHVPGTYLRLHFDQFRVAARCECQ